MPLWGSDNSANNAPTFQTDIITGESGNEEFGSQIFLTEKGWVRRTFGSGGRAGRVTEEILVAGTLSNAYRQLPANNYIAFAGDSRTANGFDNGTAGRFFLESRGAAGWAQAFSGNVFRLIKTQYGVGGDTSAMLLARWSTVLADAAGSIALFISTNDRGAANLTLQQSINNVTAMLTAAKAAGKVVFLFDEIPREGLSGTQLTNHVAMHQWLAAQEAVWNNVYVVPSWDKILDPATNGTTYLPKAGTLSDGLHPGSYGGLLLGEALAATVIRALTANLSTPFVPGETVTYPALNANPAMTGTGGTKGTTGSVTGSIADGWRGDFSSGSTAMACVCSKETISGVEYQVFTFSGTSTTNSTFTFRPLVDHTLTEGENFDMRARVKLEPSASNILGIAVEARSDGTVNQQSRNLDGYTTPDAVPTVGYDLHVWSPPCAVANTATTKRGQVVVTFTPSSVVSGVVKIARAATRKVA